MAAFQPYRNIAAGRRLPRGSEKLGEQLVDALVLVVMDPVRGVGQALDAVEVGHVVVVGFGEFGVEVVIALAPDDQGGRRDRAKRRFGAQLRIAQYYSPEAHLKVAVIPGTGHDLALSTTAPITDAVMIGWSLSVIAP